MLRRRFKHITRRRRVLLAHQNLIPAGVEGNIRTVATNRIRLNRGIDARRFQRALCEIRFPLIAECLHYNKPRFAHMTILGRKRQLESQHVFGDPGSALG